MSIMMVFEFEGVPPVDELMRVLRSFGAFVKIEEPGFVGNFSESNAFFVYSENSALEEISTDQEAPLGWKVGARFIVHCPGNMLAESAKELDDFMRLMVNANNTRFLLSFQYESIYAVRDKSLVVYKRMIE